MNFSEAAGDSSQGVLGAVLTAWERNNTVMLALLRALPEGGLEARATASSPSVAQQFAHLCHERLVSVAEEAPEFAGTVPEAEWTSVEDREGLERLLEKSAAAVRDAVAGRVRAGLDLKRNFGHPALLPQFLLWHEGYHHGQIKLALKVAGCPISDEVAGPLTWDVWRARVQR